MRQPDDLVVKNSRPSRTLGARTLHGIVLLLVQNVGSRLVNFGAQLMLGWYLVPADFGLVGLTGVVTNFAWSLQGFGVDDVLLRRHRNVRFWAQQAFWLSLTLGFLSGLLIIASAPLAGLVFKSEKLTGMLDILALAMPINALATVPMTLLRAKMRFGVLASYNAFENVGLAAATVFLAWRGFGAYSFVLPIPLFGTIKAVLFWLWAPYPHNRRRRKGSWKLLFGSSAALFWSRAINNAIGQGDYFMLGLFTSHAVVGTYYFAFRLASLPILLLAANINAVIFPALVQLQDSQAQQCEAALKAGELLNYCIMFLAFLQAALARPLLQAFFGAKWLDAIPLIQLLSIGLAFDGVSWIAGSLLGARGEFARSTRYIAILGSFLFLFVAIGAYTGAAYGTALGVCAYYMVTQPIYTYCVFRSCRIPLARIAAIYIKPTLIAAAAVGVVTAFSRLPLFDSRNVLQAAVIGAASLLAYVALVRFASPEMFNEIAWRVGGALRRGQPAAR